MFIYDSSLAIPKPLPFIVKEESIHMNFGKRGQSALEYLMTYGWALVVIVIAVAALVVLINPNTIQGNQCDAKIGPFTVSQSQVTASQAQLILVNQTGQGVTFTNADISGTDAGATAYTDTNASLSGDTSMTANQTGSLVIAHTPNLGAGQYNLTYALTYDAGQLTGVVATGGCRGTI